MRLDLHQRKPKFLSIVLKLVPLLNPYFELSKIDAKDSTSSMFLLDKAEVSNVKAGIAPLRAITTVFIIVFLVSLSVECYRNRNELFIFNRI